MGSLVGADTPERIADLERRSIAQQAQAEEDAALFARHHAHPWVAAPSMPTKRLQNAHNVAAESGDMATVQRISFELTRRHLAGRR